MSNYHGLGTEKYQWVSNTKVQGLKDYGINNGDKMPKSKEK